MIPKTYIQRNINVLSAKYNTSRKPLHFLLYSKLTIIETAGWVEMSMDDLVLRCGKKLKNTKNMTYLQETIVDKTWGFAYKSNFRPMLTRTVGLVAVEKVEEKVDGAKFAKMIAAIGNLKVARDDVAHTYVKKIITSAPIPAPAVTNSYFQDIYDGLKDFETVMKSLKIIC